VKISVASVGQIQWAAKLIQLQKREEKGREGAQKDSVTRRLTV